MPGDGSCPAKRRCAPRSNAMAERKSRSVPLVKPICPLGLQTISSTNLAVFCAQFHKSTGGCSIRPHPRYPGKAVLQPFEHGLAAIPVLDIGAGDRYGKDQTQYIDHNVPLTTLAVFTGIVAPIAPFCWVATLWLS